MKDFTIRSATLDDIKGFHACLSSVAAELKYLALTKSPPIEDSFKWMKSLLETGSPFIVAASDSSIVGWCDVSTLKREGFTHVAELGMGLLLDVRGKGVGTKLLEKAILLSKAKGIEKLELEVFSSNIAAQKLYNKFGFNIEGTKQKARKLKGVYEDVILMGLFLTDNN